MRQQGTEHRGIVRSCCECESGRIHHDDDVGPLLQCAGAMDAAERVYSGKGRCRVFAQLFYQGPERSETSVGVDVS